MTVSLFKHVNLPLAFCLTLVLSLFISDLSYAEEDVRYYDFEIIIYESLDPTARLSETWKRDLTREIPETFVTLNQPYPGLFPKQYIPKYTFKYLPRKTLQLREEAKLLKESENYQVLLHTSWRQPGMAEEVALPIHISKKFIKRAESPFSNRRDPDMPAVNLPQPAPGSIPSSINRPIESQATLDGYIKIVLKRYLHANFDLVYTTNRPVITTTSIAEEPATEDDISSDEVTETEETVIQEPVLYRLQQTRKMRSKEVHYIDHPVLGVIILATPFKLKK